MFDLIFKSFESIGKAKLLGYLLLTAILGFLVVFTLATLVFFMVDNLIVLENNLLDKLINLLATLAAGIGGWFMLPVFSAMIAGIFAEKIIDKVEKAYYPDQVRNQSPRFWPDFLYDIRFVVKSLLLNIAVLPTYLLGIGFFVSILLNAYLIGKEFFETAAGYHLGKENAKNLIEPHKFKIYGGGFVLTLLTLIPILNLFAPIVSTVYMVHLYHQLK
jgi:CysZ protein